jgi:hypothetical protein
MTEARRVTREEARDMAIHVFTLDSHECYGPFAHWREAHAWAKGHGLTSYQVVYKQHR